MAKRLSFLILLLGMASLAGTAHGAQLAPDDASTQENLCLWLRSPDVNFDPAAGVWTDVSGKGHDAVTAGLIDAWGLTYAGPVLSFGDNPQVFEHGFASVRFAGDVDDLMRAGNINDGVGLSELTIVAVYKLSNQSQSGNGMTRPVGIGSFTGEGVNLGDYFNLANDVTIRKDNGSVGGATATHPDDLFFIRVARMNTAGIQQWFNTDGTLAQVHDSSGSAFTTSVDNFYLGDLRADNSAGGPSGYSRTDIEIAEVIVYNTALEDGQIEGITQWLQASMRLERKTAILVSPADGTMVDIKSPMLEWMAGASAVSHNLYISESLDDLAAGNVEAIPTASTTQFVGIPGLPFPMGLTPGATYYWRVDEVNDVAPDSPWQGEVWSFRIRPATAWNPSPADGVPFVHPEQDLSWEKGLGVLFHTVYFGTSFEEVSNATAGGMMLVETTHDPGTLEAATTYFWRVDEFDGFTTHKSDVWSFTTVPEVAVTDPSLVGWWTLDEGEGMTAVDWSGHGHHGAVAGNAQWGDGYYGSALTFRDDVYIEMAGYAGITGTQPRTACAWIKTTATNAEILSWGEDVTGQKWIIRTDPTGGLRAEVAGGYNYGATQLVDDQWHHVAVVFEDDGSPDVLDTKLYVDGLLDTIAASQGTPLDTAATGVVRIGESPWHNTPFVGQIDDVRIYDKVLTEEEIQEVMRGNPLLAADPEPARGAIVDIREVDALRWSPGDTAASHDVYFGSDRTAVAAATTDSAEYKGNQTGTSLSLADLVAFGGGDYFWRIDEVEADGTVQAGDIWTFTVPPYLPVEDFESYTDDEGNRIYETWIDGWTNGTGSVVGNLEAPFAERTIVRSGIQSMPLDYNNTNSPFYSEAEREFLPVQDWTADGVDALTVYVRGRSANAAGTLYVAIEDSAGNSATVKYADDTATRSASWIEWPIPLSQFAGVNAARIKKIFIGVGDRANPTAGGAGRIYIDDIRATKLAPPE